MRWAGWNTTMQSSASKINGCLLTSLCQGQRTWKGRQNGSHAKQDNLSIAWWSIDALRLVELADQCNEWHSFHARVGRFSPFLYLRSVAIAVILFWLQLVVLVSPCFLGSRISRDYRFPPSPLFLCSERKPSSLTTGSSKLQFGDRQTRVKTVHYSEDRNSRCDAT